MAEVIHMDDDGQPYHMGSEGVTKGFDMRPFHWVNKETGKAVPMGTMYALGKRNLEFRRAEAEKAGYGFSECVGDNCPHH